MIKKPRSPIKAPERKKTEDSTLSRMTVSFGDEAIIINKIHIREYEINKGRYLKMNDLAINRKISCIPKNNMANMEKYGNINITKEKNGIK